MVSYLSILYISKLDVDEIAYRVDSQDIIDFQQDISLASKALNINSPFTVDDAKKISAYINNIYYGVSK